MSFRWRIIFSDEIKVWKAASVSLFVLSRVEGTNEPM